MDRYDFVYVGSIVVGLLVVAFCVSSIVLDAKLTDQDRIDATERAIDRVLFGSPEIVERGHEIWTHEKDGWGNLIYRKPMMNGDPPYWMVGSCGPDGMAENEDDIVVRGGGEM